MSGQLTEFLLRITFEGGQPIPSYSSQLPPSLLNSEQLINHIYATLNSQKNYREDKAHKLSICLDETDPQSQSPQRCNCKKSKCLKLYCECFSRGSFCKDCNCQCCQNSEEFADERARAIDQMLMKSTPHFGPRMSSGKGCNCKKTGCAKKYCQCFNSGVGCNQFCKCTNCQNRS